jgi:uncharacterized protein
LKIKVGNIPEDGLEISFSPDGEKFLQHLPGKEKQDFSLHSLKVTGSVQKIRDAVSLQMKVETVIGMECGRCLEPVKCPVEAEFVYTLVPSEGRVGEEDPSRSDEDLNFGYYSDEVIELDPLVMEQIVLRVPIKPLCNDLCKGLCPHCGTNLNTDSCGCKSGIIDHRFSALKNFKVTK